METAVHWSTLALVLLVTLALGIAVHELLHLVPLHLADASYTITVLPSPETQQPTAWATLRSALNSGLVRVEVTHVPSSTPAWVVRAAALCPLALTLPLVLVAAGVLPDPLAAGNHAAVVALIAVTGAALPSPADWSVVWHATPLCEKYGTKDDAAADDDSVTTQVTKTTTQEAT